MHSLYPRPMSKNNGNVTTVLVKDERYLTLFERGFEDEVEAYKWMMDYWAKHPQYFLVLYLNHDEYLRVQKFIRRWEHRMETEK